jgi:DNA-binding response OmpR family regulator
MVLSRSQLEERVWKDELEINSNVVDVYIRRLRRKLDPAGEIIQTVRGMGYRLVKTPAPDAGAGQHS